MVKQKTASLDNDSARNIAVNSLLAFEGKQHYIQDTLEAIFRARTLAERQRRLAAELAYGTCRQLISLDYLIARHSRRPLRRVDPLIRQILRVGLYQLIYLSATPDFAVVHEAVKQARMARLRGADGFVNAVLRSVQRDIEKPVRTGQEARARATLWLDGQRGCQFKGDFLPDPARNPDKYFSLAYAHPRWLIDRWLKRYDRETVRSICLANNARPPLMLRVNSLRCAPDELLRRLVEAGFSARHSGPGIELLQPAVPQELPGYGEGWFCPQDVTSMSVAPMLEVQPGQRIVDLCAAPGTKTTHLAELMGNKGSILAGDVSREKLALIEQNCQRLGISIVRTCLVQQLDDLCERQGPFDAVLADVPCSNTGVLARRVEARHLLKPVAIQRLARKQMEILKKASQLVKPTGTVLYSTCSIEPVENELLIERFLDENKDFGLLKQKLSLPTASSCQRSTSDGPNGSACWRHQEGGYAALLQRR